MHLRVALLGQTDVYLTQNPTSQVPVNNTQENMRKRYI